jgi:hypothetical protein
MNNNVSSKQIMRIIENKNKNNDKIIAIITIIKTGENNEYNINK